MNDYYSLRIDANPCSEDITDLAAAFLADAGFESFEPDADGLVAYIPARCDNPEKIAVDALGNFPLDVDFSVNVSFIEGEDWNSEWEKNYFKPILIDGKCAIHSTFHKNVPKAEYDIVIDPKMAFGTGHHDTTSQMVRHILKSDFIGKNVIDMGTGTGILAILAKMKGAADVAGVEIDEPAWENAIENARLNSVELNLIHGDASALKELAPADWLFANINRNIILADMEKYADALKSGGTILLSGFYEDDVPLIMKSAAALNLKEEERLVSNGWTALRLSKASFHKK
ncbi:MAG: 50S ribosomal protein L11 methyltransferase [Candidatus Amulumruptor caecigallinarius]|nr:50S ribosomal protein L11 methyltransferase [Candidatus Amulumruptor caecigallinarius]